MQCLGIVIETFFSVKNQQNLETNNVTGLGVKELKKKIKDNLIRMLSLYRIENPNTVA